MMEPIAMKGDFGATQRGRGLLPVALIPFSKQPRGGSVAACNLSVRGNSVSRSRAPGRRQAGQNSNPLTSAEQTDPEEGIAEAEGAP